MIYNPTSHTQVHNILLLANTLIFKWTYMELIDKFNLVSKNRNIHIIHSRRWFYVLDSHL
jgi:hypothetical protein